MAAFPYSPRAFRPSSIQGKILMVMFLIDITKLAIRHREGLFDSPRPLNFMILCNEIHKKVKPILSSGPACLLKYCYRNFPSHVGYLVPDW